MKKTITIGTKEFQMQSSAYTQFKYKDETGRSLIKDLSEIGKKYEKVQLKEEDVLDNYDDFEGFITLALRIAYIMSLEAKSVSGSFEDFLMQIDSYLDNTDWISEVVELAISPLSRTIQKRLITSKR